MLMKKWQQMRFALLAFFISQKRYTRIPLLAFNSPDGSRELTSIRRLYEISKT